MDNKRLSISDLEKMEYYDFMSYMGVPFFHIGGPRSTEELAGFCSIGRNSKVLMVGCGSGFSACHLAKKTGCFVVGVDIARVSVEKARQRAINEDVEELTLFITGDAYKLPFRKASFDVVITEFVSQFLDKDKAFSEFIRVLKPGGYAGINELYRDAVMDPDLKIKINEAENIFTEVTGLPFRINTPEEWQSYFERAGFTDVNLHKCRPFQNAGDSIATIKAMGGVANIAFMMLNLLKYMLLSKKLRKRFLQLDKGKKILFNRKSTRQHVGYILGTARKSHYI